MKVKFGKSEALCDVYHRKPGANKSITHYCFSFESFLILFFKECLKVSFGSFILIS